MARIVWNARRRVPGILILVLLSAVGIGRVAAQPESAAPDNEPDGRTEMIDEITVIGQRSLGALRLEVQMARERVYDLFNSLNDNDEFNIHCRNESSTGTRILQRVCRPQFADNAMNDATREFLDALFTDCDGRGAIGTECMERSALTRAQAAVSVVHLKDRQLASEVQRLTRESVEFRRAIAEYQAAEHRYEDARRGEESAPRTSVSIIGTDDAPSRRASRQDPLAPRPLELVPAALPWSVSSQRSPGEGWVKLRYTVRSDGTTADVRAVDVMTAGFDPSTAVAAVEAWRFEPALVDGLPVDWYHNLVVITFSRGNAGHTAWPEYAEAFEAVAGLIAAARLEDARTGNEVMLTELAFTLEEIALAQMQRAAIEHALGDRHAALTAIRRATEPEVKALGDEELRLALEHRFALELELGRAAEALQTFERRAALGRIPSREALARQAAVLRETLAEPETSLAIQGRVDDSGRWNHTLHWNTFAVGDVDGNADGLEVACHRRKADLPLEQEMEVTIPESWGGCALSVIGRPGTTFTLYEFQTPIGE